MEIKKIEYDYFLVRGDEMFSISPDVVSKEERVEKKRLSIPEDADGLYIKALSKGISPVREKVYISGAISKTVKVDGSPFLDLEFEDRYVGALELIVREAGEIIIPSKIVNGSLRIDMGSSLVLSGDIKGTSIRLKRTSKLKVNRSVSYSSIKGDLASLVIDVTGEEFYTCCSEWDIKAFKIEFKVREPGEGARIYSSIFQIISSDANFPYYLSFLDTSGFFEVSLMSIVGKRLDIFTSSKMELKGALSSSMSPVNVIPNNINVVWKDIFIGQISFMDDVYVNEPVHKGRVYYALVVKDGRHYIFADMLGYYGISSMMMVPFEIRALNNIINVLSSWEDVPQEEIPIFSFADSDTGTGIHLSVVSYHYPFIFADTIWDPNDYVIVRLFDKDKVYKLVFSFDNFIALMKGWNNLLKEG